MAKTKTKTKIKGLEYPRPKSSLYLCCFGISSLPDKAPTESNITGSDEHNLKQKSGSNNRWFPWQNIRLQVKSQSTRTVPLEGSECYEKEKLKLKPKSKANQVHSSKWRSKSNLPNRTQADIPSPPSQTPPAFPVTPNQKPSQSSQAPHQNNENNNVDVATCQKSSSPPTGAAATAVSHAVSLPTSKRHVRRLLSSMQVQPQTTPKEPKQHHAMRYNPVVGTCVVMVTLVIMILWGRLCAIVCTSVWLYFVPRFRHAHKNDVVENNAINNSNDLDLDSKVYKKKVVLEGLLERNHSGML